MNDFAELRDRPALDLPYVEAELHYLSRMAERPETILRSAAGRASVEYRARKPCCADP